MSYEESNYGYSEPSSPVTADLPVYQAPSPKVPQAIPNAESTGCKIDVGHDDLGRKQMLDALERLRQDERQRMQRVAGKSHRRNRYQSPTGFPEDL